MQDLPSPEEYLKKKKMQAANAKIPNVLKNSASVPKISQGTPINLAPTHSIETPSSDDLASEGPQSKSMSQSPMGQPSSSTASYYNCFSIITQENIREIEKRQSFVRV